MKGVNVGCKKYNNLRYMYADDTALLTGNEKDPSELGLINKINEVGKQCGMKININNPNNKPNPPK